MGNTPEQQPPAYPVGGGGRITGAFGEPRGASGSAHAHAHAGIDIRAAGGSPVYASDAGVVTIKHNPGGYGTYVTITNAGGHSSQLYADISNIQVKNGDVVQRGQQIAAVASSRGDTNSTGGHLHYGTYVNGVPQNPTAHLNGATTPRGGTTGANAQQSTQGSSAGGFANTNLVKSTPKNSKNSWAAALEDEQILNALKDGSWYKENPLNSYENLTYHWRLFSLPDIDLILADGEPPTLDDLYNKLDTTSQTTIAESGVTRFSIDSVIIENLSSADSRSRSTRFTKMNMKITEPNGVGFLDNLRDAASEHTVRDYHNCPYFLELTFKGYNDNGKIVTPLSDVKDQIPNGGKWVIAVQITNIEVQVTAGGGTYNLDMVQFTDIALIEKYSVLDWAKEFKGATIGTMLHDFADALNTGSNLKWGVDPNGQPIVRHQFQMHGIGDKSTDDLISSDTILNWNVKPVPLDNQDDAHSSMSVESTVQGTIRAHQGARVQDVINSIFASCPNAQDAARNLLSFLAGNADVSRNEHIVFKVEPETRYPGYDPLYGQYYHYITWHIFPFRAYTVVSSVKEAQDSYHADVQREMLMSIARRTFLIKRYEYLFTGHNTEVLELDIGFRLAWNVVLPQLQGTPGEGARSDTVSDQHNSNADPASVQRTLYDKVGAGQTAGAQVKQQNEALKSAQQRLIDANRKFTQDPSDKNKALVASATADAQAAVKGATNASNEFLLIHDQILAQKELRSILALPAPTPFADGARSYSEDHLTPDAPPVVISRAATRNPFAFDQAGNEPSYAASQGGAQPEGTGKALYGAILNQLYGTISSNFQSIQIKVRGDPYWIGPGTFEESIARISGQYDPNVVNYSVGANLIYVRFKYPLGQNDEGNVILKDEETVSGIFQVNTVLNSFENGLFTQTLNCTRYQLLDLKIALSGEGGDPALDLSKAAASAFNAGNNGGGGSATVNKKVNKQNAAIGYRYFRNHGYSDTAARAIVGNLMYEGYMEPGTRNSIGAYGIAQWLTKDRVAAFQSFTGRPLEGSSLTQQLDFVQHELTNGSDSQARHAGALLRANNMDLVSATQTFARLYERPGTSVVASSLNGRVADARSIGG